MKKPVFLALSCCLLSSCYQIQGPPQIINAGGVVNPINGREGTTRTAELKWNFQLAANQAATDPTLVPLMIDTGTALVASNCFDFFRNTQSYQRNTDLTRDMIAPAVAVLTGIVALRDFGSSQTDDYLQAFAIGSAAATASLDIVDRNFLFSADNVSEVEQLTMRALSAHKTGIKALLPMSFEDAATLLMEHNLECTPLRILKRTKDAIAAGEVTAQDTSQNKGVAQQEKKEQEDALFELGNQLGQIGSVTGDQAGALWWLFSGEATSSDYPVIARKLATMNPIPFALDPADNAYKLSAQANANKAAIVAALNALSPSHASFKSTLLDIRAKDTGQAFTVAPPSAATTTVRLQVD